MLEKVLKLQTMLKMLAMRQINAKALIAAKGLSFIKILKLSDYILEKEDILLVVLRHNSY